ncbi:hypothetical protein WA026_020400 [Henosepilachna vigintioctopunctata]|uniref:Uncharacterized protein n=1 Tax=Henosepilachna vigintioctopunctata TaxID=420089 RepID=A0AAW1UNH4_9CUCU
MSIRNISTEKEEKFSKTPVLGFLHRGRPVRDVQLSPSDGRFNGLSSSLCKWWARAATPASSTRDAPEASSKEVLTPIDQNGPLPDVNRTIRSNGSVVILQGAPGI